MSVLHDGRLAQGRVGGRVQQRLVRDGRSTVVPDNLTDDRRQVSSSAVTGHGKARTVATQRVCVFPQPANGVDAVMHSPRRAVLGRHAVVDADHDRADGSSEERAQRVVHAGVAQHPATTVEERDHRKRLARPCRPVHAEGHLIPITRWEAGVLARDVPEDGTSDPGERGYGGGDPGAIPANVGEVHADDRVVAETVEGRGEQPGPEGHAIGGQGTSSSHRPIMPPSTWRFA